jgi:hypothetical protein
MSCGGSTTVLEGRPAFERWTKDLKYTTRIPPGQKAPKSIR